MGHTHYWTFEGEVSRSEWKSVKDTVNDLVQYAIKRGFVLVNGMGDEGTKPVYNSYLAFNGSGDDSH